MAVTFLGRVSLFLFLIGLTVSGQAQSLNAPISRERLIEQWNGSSPQLIHEIGFAQGPAWVVEENAPQRFINYGPYFVAPEAGNYKVQFTFTVPRPNGPNRQVIFLDVYSSDSNQILSTKKVWLEDFYEQTTQIFSMTFNARRNARLEFRSRFLGGVRVRLEKIALGYADEGVIGELYRGQRAPQRVGSLPSPDGWLIADGGVWYYFSREWLPPQGTPNFCRLNNQTLAIGIAVQTSRDQGRSWSEKRMVVRPSLVRGSPDACSVVDGTTFFNAEARQWQILSQCMGQSGSPWTLCLYQSNRPQGPYSPVQGFRFFPRQLADKICVRGAACPQGRVYDEGTPEFIEKKLGYYYFSFHGQDGTRGYRLVARTRDFSNWEVDGSGLPNDAIFSPRDCANWDYRGNGPCIGGGAASIATSGDYTYMLIEAPTRNLACTAGQYWPVGLVRSHQIERSGGWESTALNPVIRPRPGVSGCAIQYAKIFKDGADVYLYYFERLKTGGEFDIPLFYLGNESRPTPPPVRPQPPVPRPTPVQLVYSGNSPELSHQLGQPWSNNSWLAIVTDGAGFLSYGPYATNWPADTQSVTFELAVDNNTANNRAVARIDVFDSTTGQVLAERTLTRQEMAQPYVVGSYTLPVSLQGRTGHQMEARVYVPGESWVQLLGIIVRN
jgi:hypothetical protein